MKWTNEQLDAINHDHKDGNILVSAGAGSGKTAILSERVIRLLKEGTHINELLILTFTKAASEEMKERIRKKIIKNGLNHELDLIDSSYITTFDSFALSIVKKYHYLVNLDKDISIMDESILQIEKSKIIDEVLEQYYKNNDTNILKVIKTMLRKDDKLLKDGLNLLIDKLDLELDSYAYLDRVMNLDYNRQFEIIYDAYINNLLDIINAISNNIIAMEDYIETNKDEEIVAKISDHYSSLLNCKTYNEIKNFITNSDPLRIGKITNSDISILKKQITEFYNELKKYCIYENEQFIKDNYLNSKELSLIIFKLLKEIYIKYQNFKLSNKMYSFMDIAKLAIKIFKENKDIADSLKHTFKEIMIDEYQDTSSLQESFMSYISDNNMYMVGDIKQSIYRFRYANPDLFKNKYINYKNHNGGYLIDLNKNFRSRKEVLNNINEIFSKIMTDDLGGANYKKDHLIEFGNLAYENDNITNIDHNLEIYNYDKKDYKGLNNNEIEAFIVGNDIKNKIENGYEVFNKDTGVKYKASYKDFTILVDKRSSFDNYKKIFEYLHIPTLMYENENIVGQEDMYIFKSILILLNSYVKNDFNEEYKHAYYSLSRSYLFNLTDKQIYLDIINNNYFNNPIYLKLKTIIDNIKILSIKELFNQIITTLDWYNKIIYKGECISSEAKLSYLLTLAENLDKLNYTLSDVINYFNIIEEKELKIEIPMPNNDIDTVKFMTIHNSKGLEFPVCYFIGFNNKFNLEDTKQTFIFDKNGLILPFFVGNYRYPNVELFSYKDNFLNEEISEKIRLLYVALTRSKEKMIIVTNSFKEPKEKKELSESNSFYDFINYIRNDLNKYVKLIDPDSLNINKDYKKFVSNQNIANDFKEYNYFLIKNNKEKVETEKFSKELKLKDDSDDSILLIGNHLHNLMFETDFNNPDYSNMNDNEKRIISRFINSNLLDIKNAINIYKEYEFIKDNKHGFIDLIVEYKDKFKIIDYKLSNIDDPNYIKQLKGYKEYLATLTDKKIEVYLYSLFKGENKILEI